jgi:type I restriction enzyme S subunit
VCNSIIPLPPQEERRTIAEILSVVDSVIAKTDEVIAKTERLKKGLMQTLLTRGIGHKEFKETEIGRIPKEWEVVKLGDILEICQYGLSIPMDEKGKYPIIRMDELVNGYVVPEIAKYVDLDEKTFRNFRLEKGDILFNRTNAPDLVGRTGIFLLEGDYVFASYLIRLRPKHKMFDPRFLTFYLIFSEDRLRQLATRAVHQANINATNLKKFKVPVPPFLEQQKIAEILSAVDKKLELERNEKVRLEHIKRGLMNLLLTGRIRVKVR